MCTTTTSNDRQKSIFLYLEKPSISSNLYYLGEGRAHGNHSTSNPETLSENPALTARHPLSLIPCLYLSSWHDSAMQVQQHIGRCVREEKERDM